MLVIVAERWGLHVAATRFLELEPPSPELVRAFESSRLVIERLRAATRPGATLGAILAAAKDAYREAGLPDEWRLHHQGGLIGYAARERIATPDDRMVVEAGMAVAWNPSVTGAKVEATDLVHQDGLETILD